MMKDELPACALCGELPYVSHLWKTLRCESDGCDMKSVQMSVADWRRLMARPRLAPEHVEWLRSIAECSEYGMKAYEELIQEADQGADLRHIKESVDSYRRDVDAIRAALAALGEW